MNFEQRLNIKFCFKLQKSVKEMLKLVYGDDAVNSEDCLKTEMSW